MPEERIQRSKPRTVPGKNLEEYSAGLDRQIELLRQNFQEISLPPENTLSLAEAASLLRAITLALSSLTRLIQTHQMLKDAGEPVARQLEDGLAQIARELENQIL